MIRHVLQRIHEWATRNKVGRVDDPILGQLIINESWWECTVESCAGPIVLAVGGRYEPDEALLATARQTYLNIDDVVVHVQDYLKQESNLGHWQPIASEIAELSISDVIYTWPKKPTTGMICFGDTDECRLWRCYIDGRRLFGLTFDS